MKNFKLAGMLLVSTFLFMSCEKEEDLSTLKESQKENQIQVDDTEFDDKVKQDLDYNSLNDMIADGFEPAEFETNNITVPEDVEENPTAKAYRLKTKLGFKDLSDIGYNEHRLRSILKNRFGRNPDGLAINGQYKFKAKKNPTITNKYNRFAYIKTGRPKTRVLNKKMGARDLIYRHTFYNYSNEKDTHSISRSYNKGVTKSWTVSQSVNLTIGGKVGIPLVSEGSVEISVGLSASQGRSTTNTITDEVRVNVTVPPRSKKTVVMFARYDYVKTKYTVPVYLTGYLGANFGKKTRGHYYWFPTIKSLVGGARQQKGTIFTKRVLRSEVYTGKAVKLR